MKIIMTLLVRDEEDILRANIDFHREQGVDFFIVTDNKSEDSTPAILEGYRQRGLVHYIWEDSDDYNQTGWVTRMARLAHDEYDADWVINNDADEFWWPVYGNLRSTFEKVLPEFNVVRAERFNFVPVERVSNSFSADMIYREKISLNPVGNPLPPKVAHRGHSDVTVAQGNHGVSGIGEINVIDGVIDIMHFPIRSYEQFTNKIVKGGQAYERNTSLDKNVGRTWRKLYKQYQRNGLVRYYGKQQYSARQLAKALRKGVLVEDRRLRDYLRDLG